MKAVDACKRALWLVFGRRNFNSAALTSHVPMNAPMSAGGGSQWQAMLQAAGSLEAEVVCQYVWGNGVRPSSAGCDSASEAIMPSGRCCSATRNAGKNCAT
jgi:hypothetical protein